MEEDQDFISKYAIIFDFCLGGLLTDFGMLPGPVSGDLYFVEQYYSGGELSTLTRLSIDLVEIWSKTYSAEISHYYHVLTQDESMLISTLWWASDFQFFNTSDGSLLKAVRSDDLRPIHSRFELSPGDTRLYFTSYDSGGSYTVI